MADATTDTSDKGTTTDQQSTTTTKTDDKPDEVEKWKAMARKHEAEAKSNAGAAKKLAEIEEANKTEAQKNADRLAAAEKDAADARSEALRYKIAAKFEIGDEDADLFLTGSDEETLTKQAQRLAAREGERKKKSNVVPREGTTTSKPGEDPVRAFARGLFSRGDD